MVLKSYTNFSDAQLIEHLNGNALAEEALNKSSIGMDDITDLLALTYYAGNYAHKSVQEDVYKRQPHSSRAVRC